MFAPTDAAFAKLPAGTLDTLLADPKGKLSQIFTYHVVPGKVLIADMVTINAQKVKTVDGAELTLGATLEGAHRAVADGLGHVQRRRRID